MAQQLSDPSWKNGPVYPEPSADEHCIHEDDFDGEFDGFGVSEAEMVEGEPLLVRHEMAVCARDGCDAAHERRVLFTTQTISDTNERHLRNVSGPDTLAAYVADTVVHDAPTVIRVDDVRIEAERVIEDEPRGACYGRIECDPEPTWRRI